MLANKLKKEKNKGFHHQSFLAHAASSFEPTLMCLHHLSGYGWCFLEVSLVFCSFFLYLYFVLTISRSGHPLPLLTLTYA